MFFKIKKNIAEPLDLLKFKLRYFAPVTIQQYPLNAGEQMLNNYLQQQYDITLKGLCLKIFENSTIQKTPEQDLILIPKGKFDKLAQLVTYGNGIIPGSPILKTALRLK